MPQNAHLEIVSVETERLPDTPAGSASELKDLRNVAANHARSLAWLPGVKSSQVLAERYAALRANLSPVLRGLKKPIAGKKVADDFHWLHDNVHLLRTELRAISEGLKGLRRIPHVRTEDNRDVPRVLAIAEGFASATGYRFTEERFSAYIDAFQQVTVLRLRELWAVIPVFKLVLLEEIARRAAALQKSKTDQSNGLGICVRSLRDTGQTSWKEVLEPLTCFDRILAQDPAGAYTRMDFDSRDLYRHTVANLADRSDADEMQVAQHALDMARAAKEHPDPNPRLALRYSHVGYYLIAAGVEAVHERIRFRPSLAQRLQSALRRHPDEFYVLGIEVLTLILVVLILQPFLGTFVSLGMLVVCAFFLLLPCSQSSVELMNYLTTTILEPQILPKLDLSEAVPDDCVTIVAVPTLLLNDKQVRNLVGEIEVRYLANRDRNVHFALLTDLADSDKPASEEDPLVDLCAGLIRELNDRYAPQGRGSFLLLHRHRVYNPRERVWMGWERKRGKLLDLNRLLRNQYDSFPVKVGDLSVLSHVRFVITLDSDTELPRGTAQRMIGALAHPLNQAIVDPKRNIVVAGYGILQPRVGVSVQSASLSRLANIYSGQTGFDIYTHAVSDVYQDLYGEGIFAGKGIYEVDVLHQVLDGRFPRNALLSHDLIEGAYARAGLANDIEVIDDYPSHYSAYNRRKHRWLRGDWQIAEWLFSHVPNESGHRVRNPIALISRWKIFDNLRRSLVEPATFMLLVMGWIVLPGPASYWTLVTIGILFVPAWCRFLFSLVRSVLVRKASVAREAVQALFAENVNVFLRLTFLAHQTLLSIDAIIRTLVRRMITQERLLEWETAAEAEMGQKRRTPVDTYLDATPALALVVAALVIAFNRNALLASGPVLLLWTCSKLISVWLNRPPRPLRNEASPRDELFLRRTASRTWRYFAEFGGAEHNWLIPDNLQETPGLLAARVSPTNLGLLLNARQVACEFGYLTIPEFVELTQHTLDTIGKLPRYRGHLLNWYDTQTLAPLPPNFVSSVDSGNLLASLWTLRQGALARLRRPIVDDAVAEGFLDMVRNLVDLHGLSHRKLATLERQLRSGDWQTILCEMFDEVVASKREPRKHAADTAWFREEACRRLTKIRQITETYTPWQLPEFRPLWQEPELEFSTSWSTLPLQQVAAYIDLLELRLRTAASRDDISIDQRALCSKLAGLLPAARRNATRLIQDLRSVAERAGQFADAMDFSFLFNRRRKLLSIGFDVDSQQLHSACYDLLASESRTAFFVAIAKDDIPQEGWFLLGRGHTIVQGRAVLLSWTGTMFEYLMPPLWMRTYPNTLLERSRVAAVRLQQEYGMSRGIPWGISESAYCKTDEAGNYQYHAFGLPDLALRADEMESLVISPYSSALALSVDAKGALRNLRLMAARDWFGSYGFYEAADYTARPSFFRLRPYELVRCWMAHHQGMTLLSIANFLFDGIVQQWFHADPRVKATELLLHEKPVRHVDRQRSNYRSAA